MPGSRGPANTQGGARWQDWLAAAGSTTLDCGRSQPRRQRSRRTSRPQARRGPTTHFGGRGGRGTCPREPWDGWRCAGPETTSGDNQSAKRLVEYFELLGPDDPRRCPPARRALAKPPPVLIATRHDWQSLKRGGEWLGYVTRVTGERWPGLWRERPGKLQTAGCGGGDAGGSRKDRRAGQREPRQYRCRRDGGRKAARRRAGWLEVLVDLQLTPQRGAVGAKCGGGRSSGGVMSVGWVRSGLCAAAGLRRQDRPELEGGPRAVGEWFSAFRATSRWTELGPGGRESCGAPPCRHWGDFI